jgi:hypothetical protein
MKSFLGLQGFEGGSKMTNCGEKRAKKGYKKNEPLRQKGLV